MAVGGKGGLILAVLAAFYSLALVLTALRCYVRIIIKRSFGADDMFTIAAQIVFTGLLIILTIGVHTGIGQHAPALDIQDFSDGIKYYFLCELFYVWATGLIKISFSLTLLRIASLQIERFIIYGVIAVTTIFTFFYFFFIIFTCKPVSFFWERVLPTAATSGGTCKDPEHMVLATYVHGAVICSGDLILAILPILILRKVQMKKRVKITVAVLLATGAVASVATIARIPYVPRLTHADFLYENSEIAVWSVVEIGISIVATAAGTLRPLMAKVRFLHGFSSGGSENPFSNRNGYIRNTETGVELDGGRRAKISRKMGMADTSSEEIIWTGKGGNTTATCDVEAHNASQDQWSDLNKREIRKLTEISTTTMSPADQSETAGHTGRYPRP